METTINKPKTFKDYYNDPEYKKKHIAKMLERVQCECGCEYIRSNGTKHKKTKKHKMLMEAKKKNEDIKSTATTKVAEIVKLAMELLADQKSTIKTT